MERLPPKQVLEEPPKKRRKRLDLVRLGSVLTAAGLGSSKSHIANCQKEWNLLFKLSDSMPRKGLDDQVLNSIIFISHFLLFFSFQPKKNPINDIVLSI